MPSPGASSWFQISGDTVCVTGLAHVPAFVWGLGLLVPVAWWLVEKSLSTLWGELIKHTLKRRNYLDALATACNRLAAAERANETLKDRIEIEEARSAKLFVENDRVLAENLRQAVEIAQLREEVARLNQSRAA